MITGLHPHVGYWSRGIEATPTTTGAETLMACEDLYEHAAALGFALPFSSVLDVGCGSGRLAQVATVYHGYDISPDAVAYCRRAGLQVDLMSGPLDLAPLEPPDWITCLSVCTHMGAAERVAYLQRFAAIAHRDTRLLVDVIPGDGSGDVGLWTAEWDGFVDALTATGWQLLRHRDRIGPSGPVHRYALCTR